MDITLYAICKNEEKNIDIFLKNSKKFKHTVVVDTGSTDNTVRLLKDAGIEVYEYPQSREEFDFSKARNLALSHVKTEWAVSLDFSEEIEDFHPEGLKVISNEFTAFNHERYDKVNGSDPVLGQASHIRFHRTKNYTWINAVHETPIFVPTEEHENELTVDTTIKIIKESTLSVDKQLFYLDICEREHKKDPNNSYYLWFILKHYFEVKNYEQALILGKQYLNISNAYQDITRISVFIMCSISFIHLNDLQYSANYAFHALSEALNTEDESVIGKAFIHLNELGKLINNPNIIIFSTGFSNHTINLPERKDAIKNLYEEMIQNESDNSNIGG